MASEVPQLTLDSLPLPILPDRDITFLLSLPASNSRYMETFYKRTPQDNQVPMPPARVHRSTQTDTETTRVPTPPPARERSINVYVQLKIDFGGEADNGAGEEGGGEAGWKAALVTFGRDLPTNDMDLGSSKYYGAPNGDMLRIPLDFIPWSVLAHYLRGADSEARIDLPLYERAAPIPVILRRMAALFFLISVFTATAFVFRTVHRLEGWIPQVAYYFILFGSGFCAHELWKTPFSRDAPWYYFLRNYYCIRQLFPWFDM